VIAGSAKPNRLKWLLPILIGWFVTIIGGFGVLAKYQFTSGAGATAPAAVAALAGAKPELIVFLHPQCPCSRASVTELSRITSKVGDRLKTTVYVYAPKEKPKDWVESGLFKQASAIPGVVVNQDPEGAAARRYGVRTSGQVLLYSSAGKLLFSGGITDSRGHEGDNDGEDAIVRFALYNQAPRPVTPVFGCSLGTFSDTH